MALLLRSDADLRPENRRESMLRRVRANSFRLTFGGRLDSTPVTSIPNWVRCKIDDPIVRRTMRRCASSTIAAGAGAVAVGSKNGHSDRRRRSGSGRSETIDRPEEPSFPCFAAAAAWAVHRTATLKSESAFLRSVGVAAAVAAGSCQRLVAAAPICRSRSLKPNLKPDCRLQTRWVQKQDAIASRLCCFGFALLASAILGVADATLRIDLLLLLLACFASSIGTRIVLALASASACALDSVAGVVVA